MVQESIQKLGKIGALPDEDDDIKDGFLEEYEELLESIKKPISQDEAKILIQLFPQKACFGLEWTLLHLIETTPGWPIENIINLTNSEEWRMVMIKRIRGKKDL